MPVFRPPRPEGDPGPGSPTPSPDESVIARAVRGYPKGCNSLLLVPPSGRPTRELVRLKQPERFTGAFARSPDGKYVYFARHTNTRWHQARCDLQFHRTVYLITVYTARSIMARHRLPNARVGGLTDQKGFAGSRPLSFIIGQNWMP